MNSLAPQQFDRNDPANEGRPTWFDVNQYLGCVEQMITCDEVTNALWMLDHLPGYYRANPPPAVAQIKRRLLERFFTTLDYAKDGCTWETGAGAMDQATALDHLNLERGALAFKYALEYTQKDEWVHIHELAPGNYWLPVALNAAGCRFTYFGPSLNTRMQEEAAENLPNWYKGDRPPASKSMFVCFEFIEHLADPSEIYHHYVKSGLDADVILLSTPKYTYGGGCGDWYNKDLGHLRTYTPNEFKEFAIKTWPKHNWVLHDGPVMVLAGEKA
jgi:hypothetical protein